MTDNPRTVRDGPPPKAVRLTPSEIRVLALLPTHRTLAGIGDELGIGRPTVKTHVQHIYAKLGATSRAEAVESADSAGLLTHPPDLSGRSRSPRPTHRTP
jgi:DNA-binding CsgD family transcriptional regulator